MKTFAMAVVLLASVNTFAQVVYSDSADLSVSTQAHTLVDAEYKLIPTKTTTRTRPGCVINSENYPENCEDVVVLETTPVIAVNVSFVDSTFASEGNEVSWLTFNFKPSDFDAADVAALKAASPAWRHPFSNFGKTFAKKHFSVSVKKAARSIQVVDTRNSHLCTSYGDNYPEVEPGCVEQINYRSATTVVKEVKVNVK